MNESQDCPKIPREPIDSNDIIRIFKLDKHVSYLKMYERMSSKAKQKKKEEVI